MKAMILKKLGSIAENKTPLELADLPDLVPGDAETLIRISASPGTGSGKSANSRGVLFSAILPSFFNIIAFIISSWS